MALSSLICVPSFSLLNDFASAAIRAASLKFLAAAATFSQSLVLEVSCPHKVSSAQMKLSPVGGWTYLKTVPMIKRQESNQMMR